MTKNIVTKHITSGIAKRVSGPLGFLAALSILASPKVKREVEVMQLDVHSQVSLFLKYLLLLTF